jgi:hypothetical protein
MNAHEGEGPVDHTTDPLDDLAFMKALVHEGPHMQASIGLIFMAAGLIYGLDVLAYWAQIVFNIPLPSFVWAGLSLAPPVIFLAVIVYVVWRDRKRSQNGVATRALNAAFVSAGLANLVMIIIFGYVAMTEKSMLIWLLYPAVTCAFQGAAWYIAFMIRKKLWLAFMSAGWFLTTLLLGFLIRDMAAYMLVLALALLTLMGGGGYTLMHLARKRR